MYICVDFDGTVVTHEYPRIGEPIPGALETLKKLQAAGHKLILLTMRSRDTLKDAVNYLEKNGIELYGINENPSQLSWTTSRKVYGHLYIDDAALGCPLMYSMGGGRPYVNWKKVEQYLTDERII